MVAIQLKRLVSLIALCTLVSSSTIQRVQRADNLDNVDGDPNAQNGSLSTPGKDVGPPAEIHLSTHQPNDSSSNHNSQASSHPPNRMNMTPLPITQRSVESTNKNPDDKKPNSDAGSGEPLISSLNKPDVPDLGIPRQRRIDTPIPIDPNVIQDERPVVENHASDGNFHRTDQMKRMDVEGAPIGEARINKNFQDGQQKPEGLGELSSVE